MTDEQVDEGLIDRLIMALADQVGASGTLTTGAAEALADLSRAEARSLFGAAAHLVHYGTMGDEPIEHLIDLITDVQRADAPADAAVRPGDEVRLIGELPDNFAGYDQEILRRTKFVARFVSRHPTIEVQTELTEDYMVETVPITNVEPWRI